MRNQWILSLVPIDSKTKRMKQDLAKTWKMVKLGHDSLIHWNVLQAEPARSTHYTVNQQMFSFTPVLAAVAAILKTSIVFYVNSHKR